MTRKLKLSFLAVLIAVLAGCAVDLGKDARFGAYGGKQPEPRPEAAFDVMSTKFDTRWYPSHVRWAPDDSHLLVSLCHVNRDDYCRIGKYWIAEKRWELLDLPPRTTYRWPSYAPDGKYIVASAGGCDKDYQCPQRQYALVLLTPDGKRTIKLAETIAIHPTFSSDGKKIIYWRSNGRSEDVALFDLATAKEQMLTQLYFTSENRGWPFFLDGGTDRFVFSGWLHVSAPPKDDLAPGSKLDARNGPYPDVIMYAADISKGVVTRFNAKHLEPLWPGPGGAGARSGALDVSRDGLVLHDCPMRECLGKKLEAGLYSANPIAPDLSLRTKQWALMLRPAREGAADTAAFLYFGSFGAPAISSDSRRVAFAGVNPKIWHHSDRMGIVTLGNPYPDFIDWPRFNLDPASTQRTVQ